jgi:hypothetical protein
MSVYKLKRVMQRARFEDQQRRRRIGADLHASTLSRASLVRAILIECGTDPKTVSGNLKALVNLGWVRRRKLTYLLTDKDLTEDFI